MVPGRWGWFVCNSLSLIDRTDMFLFEIVLAKSSRLFYGLKKAPFFSAFFPLPRSAGCRRVCRGVFLPPTGAVDGGRTPAAR